MKSWPFGNFEDGVGLIVLVSEIISAEELMEFLTLELMV